MLQFIHLNTYAFVLLGAGVIFIFIPLYKIVLPPWLGQAVIIFICFLSSFILFIQYQRRLRVLALLLHRNRKEFRPDTFSIVMQKLCGRLLVKAALKELGHIDKYRELKKMYGFPFKGSNKSQTDNKQQGEYQNAKYLP